MVKDGDIGVMPFDAYCPSCKKPIDKGSFVVWAKRAWRHYNCVRKRKGLTW